MKQKGKKTVVKFFFPFLLFFFFFLLPFFFSSLQLFFLLQKKSFPNFFFLPFHSSPSQRKRCVHFSLLHFVVFTSQQKDLNQFCLNFIPMNYHHHPKSKTAYCHTHLFLLCTQFILFFFFLVPKKNIALLYRCMLFHSFNPSCLALDSPPPHPHFSRLLFANHLPSRSNNISNTIGFTKIFTQIFFFQQRKKK